MKTDVGNWLINKSVYANNMSSVLFRGGKDRQTLVRLMGLGFIKSWCRKVTTVVPKRDIKNDGAVEKKKNNPKGFGATVVNFYVIFPFWEFDERM